MILDNHMYKCNISIYVVLDIKRETPNCEFKLHDALLFPIYLILATCTIFLILVSLQLQLKSLELGKIRITE